MPLGADTLVHNTPIQAVIIWIFPQNPTKTAFQQAVIGLRHNN